MTPHAVEVVHKVFDGESIRLRTVTNGSVTVTYQYLSQSFVDAAHNTGDAIDLNPKIGPFIGILPLSEIRHSLYVSISGECF